MRVFTNLYLYAEEMVLFRNGSIPRFIFFFAKRFYWPSMEPQGSLFCIECIEPFRGSKYVALIKPFKVLYRTFSSKSVIFYSIGTITVSTSAFLYCCGRVTLPSNFFASKPDYYYSGS